MCLVSHAGSRDDAFLPCRHHRPSPRNVTHTHPTTFFLFKFGPPSRVQHISIKTRPRIAFVHEMKRKLAKFQEEFFFPRVERAERRRRHLPPHARHNISPLYIFRRRLSLCVCSSSIHSAFLSPSPFASPSSLLLPPHSQRTHITVQHSSSAHDRPSRHYQNRRNAKYNLSYLTLAKTYSFWGILQSNFV